MHRLAQLSQIEIAEAVKSYYGFLPSSNVEFHIDFNGNASKFSGMPVSGTISVRIESKT